MNKLTIKAMQNYLALLNKLWLADKMDYDSVDREVKLIGRAMFELGYEVPEKLRRVKI